MKRLLLLASSLVLLAGCASDRNSTYRGTTGSMGAGTDAGYGIGIAPTQQGAGAVGLTTSQLSADDLNFLRRAAQDNQTDIAMGQTIVQRSQTPALTSYGQRLIDDHTVANQQLMTIVAHQGVTVPTAPNSEQQQTLNQLAGLNGPDFDRAAIHHSIRHQEREVNLYTQAANSVQDPQTRTYAQQNLSVVQDELTQARQLIAPTPTGAPNGIIITPQPQ